MIGGQLYPSLSLDDGKQRLDGLPLTVSPMSSASSGSEPPVLKPELGLQCGSEIRYERGVEILLNVMLFLEAQCWVLRLLTLQAQTGGAVPEVLMFSKGSGSGCVQRDISED